MNDTNKTQITKDLKRNAIIVSRVFNAPIEKVWQAYTDHEILDQWWGPYPWKAETKSMNFKKGGHWLYSMKGPNNQRNWSRMNYLSIDRYKSIEVEDVFCDEKGNPIREMPAGKGKITFTPTKSGVRVDFKSVYSTEADLKKLIELGFEEGISICYDQLEGLLKKVVHLH